MTQCNQRKRGKRGQTHFSYSSPRWRTKSAQCHILFPATAQSALIVGRTPRSAADAPVGLHSMDEADFVGEERVQGDPCGPGGPPHKFRSNSRYWEKYVALGTSACATALLQMHGLGECSIAGGIPRGETDPFLAGGIEWEAVAMRGKRRQRSRGTDFAAGGLAVAPDQLHEFGGPGPIHVDDEGALRARALDGVIMQQDFARRP